MPPGTSPGPVGSGAVDAAAVPAAVPLRAVAEVDGVGAVGADRVDPPVAQAASPAAATAVPAPARNRRREEAWPTISGMTAGYPAWLAAIIRAAGRGTVAWSWTRQANSRRTVRTGSIVAVPGTQPSPRPVVATMLGYQDDTTTRIAAAAGSPWIRYAPGDHKRS
ncbi:hypothetical protein FDG2_5118 [Candidatus Protofrankia californiensis]|uniref:Uncharacterized protein n=1 Tax=Candidatus Protofrankia californiensis TaxID=1839754 RepID=A0A1C3PB05_9ACTN|nr:hypothetical protein FDG2_5118 [Candidatus Protofrankia californiensis]